MSDLDQFSNYLKETKKAIEDGIETLEKGKKMRELKRKEILASEMKRLLTTMAKNDTKVVQDLKGEAFDMLQSINKVIENVKTVGAEHDIGFQKAHVQSLEFDEFLRSLNITISSNPDMLASTVDKLSDAVYISSPVLNPQHLFLQLANKQALVQPGNFNCKYVSINIFSGSDSIKFTPSVMRELHVVVEGIQSHDQRKSILEETTVFAKMNIMKASISDESDYVTVQLKRPRNGLVRISVKALGSNIVNSPIIYEYNICDEDGVKDNSLVNDTLGMFDMTGLDESDIVSLDMTRRRQFLVNVGKNQLMANPTFAASPAFHRKVSKQPNISSVAELPSLEIESVSSMAVVTLPLSGNPIHESSEDDEQCQGSREDDPHLLLNASKAPSPRSARCWQKEDSVWEDAPNTNQNEEEAESNTNVSMLPLPDTEKSIMQDDNVTLWGEEITDKSDDINFLNCSIEVENVFKSHKVAESSSRGPTYCLESPCSVAFLPLKHLFLVTEPAHHRIGVYDGSSFQFVGWLGYPLKEVGRKNFNYPTSVLTLRDGCMALLEKDRLHIFDGDVRHLQSIQGSFNGLTEGSDGEIFTISKNEKRETFLKRLTKENLNSKFKVAGRFHLEVIQTFNDWQTLTKTRFLTYCRGNIIITDLGLHKLYTVDLHTGEQTACGYMGSKMGQFQRPTGLVADDVGNLVIGDSDNNRLVVFNKAGQMVRIVPHHKGLYYLPNDLLRVENSLLAVYMAIDERQQGAVVRYKLVPS